jgi:transposase-like protein
MSKRAQYTTEEKVQHLKDWRASGLSIQGYSRKHGIKDQTFYNWTTGRSLKGRDVRIAAAKVMTEDGNISTFIKKYESRINTGLKILLAAFIVVAVARSC